MIRNRRISGNWRVSNYYPPDRRELAYIFSISLRDLTINEMKAWRLKDITHYICPFCPKDIKHQQKSVYDMVHHIPKCFASSIHGLNGKEAKDNASNWTFCDKDESHMFHQYFEQMHYELFKKCKINRNSVDE